MNKHILLVMKWLNDKDSVTQQELVDNRNAAYAAYAAAADATAAYAAYAEKWVNKYFERTDDNKQDYIDALNGDVKTTMDAVNEFKGELDNVISAEAKPVYTQEMADNGVLPSVGMECLIFNGELHNPEYEKAEIDFIGVHVAVYSSESCTERTCNLELIKFKPIDQRTDKEKAIDEAYKELILASGKSNFKNELGNIYDKWVK